MQHTPIDHFTQAQIELASRNAPAWTLQDVERVERPMVQRRRAPEPVAHSPWAHRAVWCALVLGALVALLVR